MGYFYAQGGSATYNKCLTESYIKESNGSIVENTDGTVSVYMPNGPILLTKVCCEALKSGYSFDIDTQKCKWTTFDACDIENPFKITLNPDGNDGTLFYLEDTENCYLNINFDYLFKFKCEKLTSVINQSNAIQSEITDVTNQINEQIALCDDLTNQISILEEQIANSSYSIVCETFSPNISETWDAYPITTDFTRMANFENTAFAPFSWVWKQTYTKPTTNPRPSYFYNTSVTYCLTEPKGLNAWSQILGTRYQSFLNGDPLSYTCDDVNAIVAANSAQIAPYGFQNTAFDTGNDATPVIDNGYVVVCSTPFGTKTNLINQLNVLKERQIDCENELNILNSDLTNLTNAATNSTCSQPINAFETLDVSMLIEVISGTSLVTVSETTLFKSIGANNLYEYLATTTNSGFYVCGTPADGNTSITACTPLIMTSFLAPYSFDLENYANTNKCSNLANNLVETLFQQSNLVDTQLNRIIFNNSLSPNVFASKWLSFNTEITDSSILETIKNQKIKISFKVNSHCGDFCLLLDNVQLNKNCKVVKEEQIVIPKSPGFELDKIRDNKKSWLNNVSLENRPFHISTNIDTNTIRQTNYDVLDERLVINTKEIDLDISIASAIETDVWCYIVDNPCLLTGITNSGQTVISCPIGYSLTPESDSCLRTFQSDVITSLITYTATQSTAVSSYNKYGTNFYANIDNAIFPIGGYNPLSDDNGTGTTITLLQNVRNTLWGDDPSAPTIKGRLNNIGVWATTTVPNDEWIGFTHCLTLTEGGVYSLGICGDNYVRIKVNGQLIINIDLDAGNFNYWHVFPLTFTSGINIIELEGANQSGSASFGAEIYSTTPDVLSGLTATTQLEPYIVFSTKNKFGEVFDLGQNSGLSCPDGYSLNSCDTTFYCTRIDKVNVSTYTSFCESGNTCGDTIDFNHLMTQSLTGITTIEEFEYFLTSELIDAKSRKTLSSYPTLRALYERYMNSTNYCGTESSKFDYMTMDKFANLVGDYWIDLVEQVVPATTIWGSAKIYSNNIFDQQKFQYKKGSLFTCTNSENPCDVIKGELDFVNGYIDCILNKFYLTGSTL